MSKPVKRVARAADRLVETTLFEPDDQDENTGQNAALAALLAAPWAPLAIVRIERIEIGDSGWRVVFRA